MSPEGKVITFYSYKGGTGRTMALANTGVKLARDLTDGGRVLMLDWDLEAPGLCSFFPELELPDSPAAKTPGVLEIFEGLDALVRKAPALSEELMPALVRELDLDRFIVPTAEPSLDLIRAGYLDESYRMRVSDFDWPALFDSAPMVFKAFADELASRYSYVLIDSRTGISDAGDVCTSLLPERLVVVFTPNQQSLTGVVDLVQRATTYRSQSADLRPLIVFPLASRVEMSEEELRRRWRHGDDDGTKLGYQRQFEQLFEEVYDLPTCPLEQYFDEVQIQHAARYAYGEQVAVRDEQPHRLSLRRSYEQFARALLNPKGPWKFEKEATPSIHPRDDERSEEVLGLMRRESSAHGEMARRSRARNTFLLVGEVALAVAAVVGAAIYWIVESVEPESSISLANEVLPLLLIGVIIVAAVDFFRRMLAFDKRYEAHARAANAIKREASLFESSARPYSRVDEPTAMLTERFEGILTEYEDAMLTRGYSPRIFDRLSSDRTERHRSD
ncbi:MAG: LuxR family transcriptional regulator, glucitol operon activator [Solirubrobacterales bacterium]|jgi:cellulose biosynthesis protein BcsQ|nr:LuxR family transcriptional regulator, glucitol operon activator [Solirubrobacterales bacterium]